MAVTLRFRSSCPPCILALGGPRTIDVHLWVSMALLTLVSRGSLEAPIKRGAGGGLHDIVCRAHSGCYLLAERIWYSHFGFRRATSRCGTQVTDAKGYFEMPESLSKAYSLRQNDGECAGAV